MIRIEQDTVTLSQTQIQTLAQEPTDLQDLPLRRREDTSIPATPVSELNIPVAKKLPVQETIVPYRLGYRLPDSLYNHLISRRNDLRASDSQQQTSMLESDSTASDSTARPTLKQAIEITPIGGGIEGTLTDGNSRGSWGVLMFVMLVFVMICIKYRKNTRFMGSLVRDLYEVRERHNMFDETVRERWFMILLNLLCVITTGILLSFGTVWFSEMRGSSPGVWDMVAGMGISTGYTLLCACIYWISGMIFSERKPTLMWLRAYWASQSLIGVSLFIPLLLVWFNPQWSGLLLPLCLGIWLLIKIIYISKVLRIFFTKEGSIIPFFYYLCSAEAVPAVISWYASKLLIVENAVTAWQTLGEWALNVF